MSFRRSTACALAAALFIAVLTPVPAASAAAPEPATLQPAVSSTDSAILDRVVFGDAASEAEHGFRTDGSDSGTADGVTTRIAKPLAPLQNRLGDLVVTVQVDPTAQNYLSMTFSGDEASAMRTNLLVDGQYINYLSGGDYESINPAHGAGLPGREYTSTTLLPLEVTQGRDSVQVTVRTAAAAATALAGSPSRTYFDLTTHLTPSATLATESARAALDGIDAGTAWTAEAEDAAIQSYRTAQLNRVAAIAAKIDGSPTGIPDIQKYANELRYYAEALVSDWSPDDTAEKKSAALERIFAAIDRYTVRYYGDVRSLGSGGHQSDWGGFYAELGEALYIVEDLIADDDILGRDAFEAFLGEPFATNTVEAENSVAGVDWNGAALNRGEAWERVLKASFDFARSRLSYISNQVHYNYEGAWRSHEGLRVIGSSFYEGRERSHEILREIWGISPFLGEEVLVGPDGAPLDLYHSLFAHDGGAEYTDDYVQIVMKGLAKSALDDSGKIERRTPYGQQYLSITEDALLRENHYVGSYGETANWLPTYFWRTWGHAGDEDINAELLRQALKNIHSRGLTRYQGVTADGHRVMYMDQIVDERNIAYPGKVAYATESASNLGLMWVSLEEHMVDNAELYKGDEWVEYRGYAAEAVGFMQQQLADNQYFPYFASGTRATAQLNKDHRAVESWAYLNGGRAAALGASVAGVILPNTDLTLYSDEELERLGVSRAVFDAPAAWADIDNLLVRVRDGDTTILGSLAMRNYGYLANGRLHVQRAGQEQLVQIATAGDFEYQQTTTLAESAAGAQVVDPNADSSLPGLARAGQVVPITYQQGVGTVVRDNFIVDNPYSGYPDLIHAAYGEYVFAINTTRDEYGNAAKHNVTLPAGYSSQTVQDLVSGTALAVRGGKVSVPAHTAVVLRVSNADRPVTTPQKVDAVALTPSRDSVAVSWRLSPGASAYRIERAVGDGTFEVVARGATGSTYLDHDVRKATYRYRVVATNGSAAGEPSDPVGAKVTGATISGAWENGSVGDVGAAKLSVRSGTLTVTGATAAGFGEGDDFVIYDRFTEDDVAEITQPRTDSYSLTAKIGQHAGDIAGLTIRQGVESTSPYAYLGAGADGQLEIRLRTLDTRVNVTGAVGTASAKRTEQTSPRTVILEGFTLSEYPYLRLDRDASGQRIIAQVSTDGKAWVQVAHLALWTPGVTQAGVVTTGSVTAEGVALTGFGSNGLTAGVRQDAQRVNLVWTRPEAAASFRVYRTTDAAAATKDPRQTTGWSVLANGTYNTGIGDTLVGKDAWYVIASLDERGTPIALSAPTSAKGYPLVSLIAEARAIDLTGWTAPSGAAFLAEVDAIESAAAESGADHATLAVRLEAAYALLVQLYLDGFESDTASRWTATRANGTPTSYIQVIDDDPAAARTGSGSLLISNTGSELSAAHNAWYTNASSTSLIDAAPSTTYRITFQYQLSDYGYAATVGAYLFVRGYSGSAAPEPETRFWFREPSTPPGEWKTFSALLTTSAAEIDHFVFQVGLRGSTGSFRVDDLRVEPVDLLEGLLADARAVDLSPYTAASAALYTAELNAIEAAAAEAGADRTALIIRAKAASALLVQVYADGFEAATAPRWASARASGTPATYTAIIESDPATALSGSGSLLLASTDTTLNAAYNLWYTNSASAVPVKAAPSTKYRITFRYQLTDYGYATGVGAYLFTRGFSGTTGGTETRFWLREPSTTQGEWGTFDTTLTTSTAAIDRLVLQFGLRGSTGSFRVDDVRIEPLP